MPRQDVEARAVAFLEKVEARLGAVFEEAAAAFADVAGAAPLDPAPIHSIEGALQGRFVGLSDRVEAAWDQLDEEIGSPAVRDRLHDRFRALHRRVDDTHERCKVTSLAAIGHTLGTLAEAEDQTVRCTQCGAPFDPGTVWQTTNVPCPHCSAVNAVGPGPATMQWYSRGAGYLADAEALDAFLAHRRAERDFDALRHPTTADLDTLLAACRTYHRARTDALVRIHPAWTPDQAHDEVEGFVGKLRGIHGMRGSVMARTAAGLEVAAKRQPHLVEQWVAVESPGMGRTIVLDGLLEAAVERGLRAEADTLVRVVHKEELPWWFGKDRWVRAKLRELSPALA